MDKKIEPYWKKAEKIINKQLMKVPYKLRKEFVKLLEKNFVCGFEAGEEYAKSE